MACGHAGQAATGLARANRPWLDLIHDEYEETMERWGLSQPTASLFIDR